MDLIFRPRYSFSGFISLIFVGLAIFLGFIFLWLVFGNFGLSLQTLFSILIFLSLVLLLVFIALYFSIRYVMKDSHLQLSCGPFSAKIPYNEISGVKIGNLDTGGRLIFPGVALGPISYINAGDVLMMATRAEKEILLIMRENGKLYGITPSDPENFLIALKERIPSEIKEGKELFGTGFP